MTTGNTLDVLSTAPISLDTDHSRLILQNIDEPFILANHQLEIVYYNRAAKEIIARLMHLEVSLGMSLLQISPENRRQKVAALYRQVLAGERHSTEIRLLEEDGAEVFFHNNIIPAYDGDRIIGLIVASLNITEKKKAQAVLKESEERLQFALEAANQGVWDWNLATNEVIYSSSYKKLYGFSEDDLKNDVSEWITRIHPDDQRKMKDMVVEHLQSDDPVYDSQYRIRGKDGRYRWVMAKGRLLNKGEDGRYLRMIGTHTDITETIERETALKRSNERFDCVMKATHEVLWEWDIATNEVTRSMDSLKKLYGVKDDSHIRQFDSWLQYIHPEDREMVERTLRGVLQAPHQHTFEMEYRFKRSNGSYAHIYDRGILLRDENDKPFRVIGSAEDISERKRLEKELLQKSLEYHRLIHLATVETQEKERAEIGKELHDNVNQVLTTTKLYLDLALVNSERKEELIRKSLQNINSVIQEIRHLSRSLMDPSIDDLGLVDSINDLVENIHLTRKLTVTHNADPAIDFLLDANQKLGVFRIIQESMNNILRHAGATEVKINLSVSDGRVHLLIQDNGVGFDPITTKKGAGLKNIQNRIYLINGTLQLRSSHQNGCSMILQFPINEQPHKIQ
ncbi:sensor histidine kinase [Flavisolibacter nicotianae]|uniref:sensor histidine kinase n=1 Tax=Flavisolibacter nicotianae TaxID=2364882 RepID=UPI000EB25163|nr:PAS domain-containing protein [Flavisolibacter nicotianae]